MSADVHVLDYIKDESTWFDRQIKTRLAWLMAALLLFVVVGYLLKFAAKKLWQRQFSNGLKTLGLSFVVCIVGIPLLLACVFFPKFIGTSMVRLIVLPRTSNLFLWVEKKFINKAATDEYPSARAGMQCEEIRIAINVHDKKSQIAVQQLSSTQNDPDKYLLKFMGNAAYVNLEELMEDKYEEQALLLGQYKLWFVDHLSVGNVLNPQKPQSARDMVNAGIAVVYEVMQKQKEKWTIANHKTAIEQNIQLSGFSMGGAIALQVARHFKERHGLNLKVLADRTFSGVSDVMVEMLTQNYGLPLWLAKMLTVLIIRHAGGDWELNALKACAALDPDCVSYINVMPSYDNEGNIHADLTLGNAALAYRIRDIDRHAENSDLSEAEKTRLRNLQHKLCDGRSPLVYWDPTRPNRYQNVHGYPLRLFKPSAPVMDTSQDADEYAMKMMQRPKR